MDQFEIEKIAREELNRLWKLGGKPRDLFKLLEPGVALEQRGFSVESVPSLGEHVVNGVRSEVAGAIDCRERKVEISMRFPSPVQRFTCAHELGHAVLHPNVGGMHRDLPLRGVGVTRDSREIQANHFASNFLMPRRMVENWFIECFRIQRFELTDAMAFALCGNGAESVRRRCGGLRGLSRLVASAISFNTRPIRSMHSLFQVSVDAMAIRLEELDLVAL